MDERATQLFLRYDNANDYFAECSKPCELRPDQQHSITNEASWTHSDSLEQTFDRYRKGYPEATAEARKLMVRLTPFLRTVKAMKRSWVAGRHAGGAFIMDSYNKGLPDCCMNMGHVVSKKFVNIIVNNSASASVDTSILIARGVAMIALANALQSQNYRVSVKLVYGIGNTPYQTYIIINLKRFEQSFDLDRLAFFLGDPSALRRLHFAFAERQPRFIAIDRLCAGGGYGHPIELPKEELTDKDLYLSAASYHGVQWTNLDACQTWLKETLKRYGVEVL